jgi:hypothetical protein
MLPGVPSRIALEGRNRVPSAECVLIGVCWAGTSTSQDDDDDDDDEEEEDEAEGDEDEDELGEAVGRENEGGSRTSPSPSPSPSPTETLPHRLTQQPNNTQPYHIRTIPLTGRTTTPQTSHS